METPGVFLFPAQLFGFRELVYPQVPFSAPPLLEARRPHRDNENESHGGNG